MCFLDEHTAQQLKEHDGKKLMNVTKEGQVLGLTDEEKGAVEEEKSTFEGLRKKMKEILGKSAVKTCRITCNFFLRWC